MRKKKSRSKSYANPILLISFIILTMIMVLSFGLLEFYQYLNKSPYFKIKEIRIKGCKDKRLERYIMDILKSYIQHVSIIFLNIDEIKKRIEMHPYIKSVSIKKQFPDKLIINIKKESPLALVTIGDDLFYVDAEGYIFKKAKPGDYVNMPVITGLNPNYHDFDKRLKKVVKILNLFSEINPYSYEISEIYVNRYGNTYLYLSNKDIEVLLSHDIENINKKEILKKLQKLKKVLNYFPNCVQINFIDLDSIKNGVIIGLNK